MRLCALRVHLLSTCFHTETTVNSLWQLVKLTRMVKEVAEKSHALTTPNNGDCELSHRRKKRYLLCRHDKLPDTAKPVRMACSKQALFLFAAIFVFPVHMLHISNFHAWKLQLKIVPVL